MGHGIREDSHKTRLWFVTTGYIVRLLANQPSYFDNHTHLIIDEVHERSVVSVCCARSGERSDSRRRRCL